MAVGLDATREAEIIKWAGKLSETMGKPEKGRDED